MGALPEGDTKGEESYQTIEVEREESFAILRLNRPDRLNAFDAVLVREVIQALDALETDETVRAVILCGAGRAFSSGFDIKGDEDESKMTVVEWRARSQASSWKYVRRIWSFRKPIIAAVHGYCLGGACEVAMLCDMTIAAEDCSFGEPEIRFGTGSPALIMPWVVPLKIAKELMLSGKTIDAKRAYEVGMVNEVVPNDQLMRRARYHARLISRVSPLGVELVKDALNTTYEIMGLQSALAYNANLTAILEGSSTPEFQQFEEIRLEQGLRAALKWRDRQFKELEGDV